MPRLPYLKFYPSDWHGEVLLRSCSPVARVVWFEMILAMHEAEPRGYLYVGGSGIKEGDVTMIARIANVKPSEAKRALLELKTANVYGISDDGTLFSRRMVREEAKANENEINGKAGGNPDMLRGSVPKDQRIRGFRRGDSPQKTDRIFDKSNGRCHYCGVALQRDHAGPDFFQVDHVIPIRDGGTNDESNLVAACASCNHGRARASWVDTVGTSSDNNPPDTVGYSSDSKAYSARPFPLPETTEDLRLPGPDGAQAREPVSLTLGDDQPSAPRRPRQQKLPTGPKPEHLLLGAIWPILRARIPVAMTQTDWRKRNTSTAKSMLAAGIEPEQIVRVIEFIGADEEARKWWGETLMLDKIQKAWANIVRRMGERAPRSAEAQEIPEGYVFDAELGAAYPLATLKVLAPERYREVTTA